MKSPEIKKFQKLIWNFYAKNRRDFPWRNTTNPYHIVVSEIMLQQTQTDRVVSKYNSFLKKFSTAKKLADASLQDVLTEWKGLGYNRRAIALQRIAKTTVGKIPQTKEELIKLPSIGPNTAGSILAFAYNKPSVFIETNIRTVFIHHFFFNKENEVNTTANKIDDSHILTLIEKTVDLKNPREWYYALMDYGNYLKKTGNNKNNLSKHHRPQSPFKGSNREQRSKILDLIREKPRNEKALLTLLSIKPSSHLQIKKNLADLVHEGFIVERSKGFYRIA